MGRVVPNHAVVVTMGFFFNLHLFFFYYFLNVKLQAKDNKDGKDVANRNINV